MSNISQDLRKLAESIVPGLSNAEYNELVHGSMHNIEPNISQLEKISGTKKYETRLVSAIIDELDATPSILSSDEDYLSNIDINTIASIDMDLCGRFNIKTSATSDDYINQFELQEDNFIPNQEKESDDLTYDPASRTYLESAYTVDDDWDEGEQWFLKDVRTDRAIQKGNMLNDALSGSPRHWSDFSNGHN